MLISVGERISVALAAMAINDLGHEAISLTGSQAGIVTDTAHGKAKIVDIRGQRIHEALDQGQDRARRRLPGGVDRQGDHDAGSRRFGHDRGRTLGGARSGCLRDLHRRRGGLHRRPADRRRGAQAGRGELRRDARDVRVRGEGHGSSLCRVRAQLRCEAAREIVLRRRRGHVDRRGGRTHAGEGDHLGRHARHDRGEGDDHRRARPPRRGRARLPAARRRGREHRHDRPERLRARARDDLVHDAEDGPRRRRAHPPVDGAASWARSASRPIPTSRRCR